MMHAGRVYAISCFVTPVKKGPFDDGTYYEFLLTSRGHATVREASKTSNGIPSQTHC